MIVTGSSRGLGLASAKALAAEGCRVTLCARTEQTLRDAAREVAGAAGGEDRVRAVAADVSQPEGVALVIERTVQAAYDIARFTAEDPTLPQGPLKWFTEGFTSYYGAMTLLCDGTLSPSGFVRVMNAEIARYYANPAAHRARLTSTDGYFERPEIKELAYNKGMLLAWLMDLRIRHLAPGRSLGDFMKAVMVFSARGETFER